MNFEDVIIYMGFMVIGLSIGIAVMDEGPTPIEELKEMCSEIDELCEKDFLNLCELTYPEFDAFADIKKYVEFLEEEADIYGDTWRESDCGIIISQEQEEMREYNPWVNKPRILR